MGLYRLSENDISHTITAFFDDGSCLNYRLKCDTNHEQWTMSLLSDSPVASFGIFKRIDILLAAERQMPEITILGMLHHAYFPVIIADISAVSVTESHGVGASKVYNLSYAPDYNGIALQFLEDSDGKLFLYDFEWLYPCKIKKGFAAILTCFVFFRGIFGKMPYIRGKFCPFAKSYPLWRTPLVDVRAENFPNVI